MRILICEDDRDLAAAVEAELCRVGYAVDCAYTGGDGLHFALQNAYDLILLDRMLPERDGVSVLKKLRSEGMNTPVLMVTARGSVGDRVEGLDAGADDYLVKPFAPPELLARIRALLRRPKQWESTARLSFCGLELDAELCTLRGPNGACTLSRREARLLEIFLRNAGQTMTRELLLARVWGPDAPVEDGNLDNYIHFLRRRLDAAGSSARLVTVRGVGYRLEEDA